MLLGFPLHHVTVAPDRRDLPQVPVLQLGCFLRAWRRCCLHSSTFCKVGFSKGISTEWSLGSGSGSWPRLWQGWDGVCLDDLPLEDVDLRVPYGLYFSWVRSGGNPRGPATKIFMMEAGKENGGFWPLCAPGHLCLR